MTPILNKISNVNSQGLPQMSLSKEVTSNACKFPKSRSGRRCIKVTGALKILYILILLFTAACDARPDFLIFGKPPERDELYGTYFEKYKFASETFILNRDGTYMQEITLKSNQHKSVVTGKWKIYNDKDFRNNACVQEIIQKSNQQESAFLKKWTLKHLDKYYYVAVDDNFLKTLNWMGDFDSGYETYERNAEVGERLLALKVFKTIYLGGCDAPNLCYKKISNEQKPVIIVEKADIKDDINRFAQ